MFLDFQALSAARIENQMALSRAVMEERAQKSIAVQQALQQARQEFQEKMDSVAVVSDDKCTTYSVNWGHQDVQNNITGIMDGEEELEKDKEWQGQSDKCQPEMKSGSQRISTALVIGFRDEDLFKIDFLLAFTKLRLYRTSQLFS